ncbi:phage minor head protein [Campylobacter geochelonis]|uniref:phage head morphogenesis protein n=1 Tax=Campylobacter geochelonis TaxID=1780362 RepID=UPI0007709A19|nr:phage minor head protein [Campylobacter geochelonis]CZE50017.1 putative prophage MuSo1%2C F protein [Campylobacter geochelonis]
MQSFGEYFRYTAVLDNRTRKSHARLHGTILPKTDKFWDRNYPPNGWGCRCSVQVLTKKEIQKRGLTPLADSSMLKDVSDKAFAYNPKVDRLDSILKDKARKLGCNDVKANGGGLKFNSPCDKVKLSIDEIKEYDSLHKQVKELWNSEGKNIILAKSNDLIKKALQTNSDNILLSNATIQSHLHHPEITAAEYALVPFLLKNIISIYSDSQTKKVFVSLHGRYFRLVLKKTQYDEIFLNSLLSSSSLEKLEKKLRKKDIIYKESRWVAD